MADHDHCSNGRFVPSLWKQRRQFILDTLDRFQIETVLDYGCGEASVLSVLCCPDMPFRKLAGIDIDPEVLQDAVKACKPHASDYAFPRTSPLSVDIYQGSIGVADARLRDYEAIICSEVIEHVYPDVLQGFLDLTLGIYQPRLMIVTTPNAEYNVYFPNLQYGTPHSLFRHDDHKFEWTRAQFEAWCQTGATKYGYQVEFHGIGLLSGKEDAPDQGHCTQACIFIQSDPPQPLKVTETPHQLIEHIVFPTDRELSQEELLTEIQHYLQALCDGELYYQQKSLSPALKMTHSFELEPITDWSNVDISHYLIPTPLAITEEKPTSVQLDFESLWKIDRVQHICKTQESLRSILLRCCQLNQQFTLDHNTIHCTIS